MTPDGTLLIGMGRNRVPHVAHFTLLGGARARVLILRALMLISLISMRPDAHGGWHMGCADRVCKVWGAHMRLIIRTPGRGGVHASVVALSRCAKSRQSRSRGDRTARRHYTEYTATCTHVLHSTLKVLLGSLATSLHSPVMSQGGAVALSPFYIVPDGRSWPFDVSFDGDFTGMQVVQ